MRLRRRSFGLFTLFAALPLRSPAAPLLSKETMVSVIAAAAYELFPHDNIDATLYGSLADAFVSADEDRSGRLTEALGGAAFRTAARAQRIERLSDIQSDADFFALRMHVLMGLYNNPEVARRFGYEGPSLEQGGYLERGFDDLRWLPEPAEHAG